MNRFIPYLKSALFLVLVSVILPAQANVFSDKEYGYLLKYPDGWQASTYRSGIVLSRVLSTTTDSGLQVRLVHTRHPAVNVITKYVEAMEKSLKAKLMLDGHNAKDGVDYYDAQFIGEQNGKPYMLYSRLLFYPDINAVLILQSGFLHKNKDIDLPKIRSIMESLWVFKKSQLAPKR